MQTTKMSNLEKKQTKAKNNGPAKPNVQTNLTFQLYNLLILLIDIVVVHAKVVYYILESIYTLFVKKEEADVRGEIVLITGAAHGIGKELALQYGSLGARVVCLDINEKGNQETVKEIKTRGGKAYHYVCNVTQRDNIHTVCEKVKKEVGIVNILVNNAGIMPCHPLLQHTEAEIRNMFDINVLAHFWFYECLLPDMIANNRGHIVSLSSLAGVFPIRNLVPYCGTKFAVRGIMQTMIEEFRDDERQPNIKFTTICPYMVDTGLCKNPRMRFPELMKLVKPEEAASAIILAQRRGVEEASIPGHFLAIEKILKLLPKKAARTLSDFLDSGVDSDLR